MIRYTIAIPARNESGNIERTLRGLADQFAGEVDVEMLVIDNESTDETFSVCSSLQSQIPSLRVVRTTARAGYGVSIKQAIESAFGEYVIFVMADGSERPADVGSFIAESRRYPQAHVFGNRFAKRSQIVNYPRLKLIVNRVVNKALSLITGRSLPDLTNGFKLFITKDIRSINFNLPDDFSITVALSVAIARSGRDIRVVEHDWIGRDIGESKFKFFQLLIPYARACQLAFSRGREI